MGFFWRQFDVDIEICNATNENSQKKEESMGNLKYLVGVPMRTFPLQIVHIANFLTPGYHLTTLILFYKEQSL